MKYRVTLYPPFDGPRGEEPCESFESELDGILDPMIRFWMPGTIISSCYGNNKITALYPTNQYRKIVIEKI
jgi:hypothetical protein